MNYYDQASGNDDWSDFIDWLYFFNSSSNADFEQQLKQHIDVGELLRLMVVESFLLSTDNLASGNNLYVYHGTESDAPDQMSLITYDFDDSFKFDPVTNAPKADPNIFTFFLTLDLDDYEDVNPLLNRLLAVPSFNATYVEYYNTFLTGVFGSQSPQQPGDRFAQVLQYVLPWAARDRAWQLSYGMTVDAFVLVAERSIANLPLRYENCTAQIASVL